MKNALVLIGNGFSKDLYDHLRLGLNPSRPFKFNTPYNDGLLLDKLSNLKKLIKENKRIDDYKLIEEFITKYSRGNGEQDSTHAQLGQYLAMSYAYVQDKIMQKWDPNWKWQVWFKENISTIKMLYTLNYSLELETLLNKLGINFHRLGTDEENNPVGIPIFKPHGSSDFDFPENGITMPLESRLTSIVYGNNFMENGVGRLEVVAKDKLRTLRIQADLVLPFEHSQEGTLLWVEQGYEKMISTLKGVESCLIIGVSYDPYDRLELDKIFDSLPKNLPFVAVNLHKPSDSDCPESLRELETKLNTISVDVKFSTPSEFFNLTSSMS